EPTGRRRPGPRASSGAQRSIPDALVLCEIRKEFSLGWDAIEAFERGARVLDTAPAEQAAREVALAEDDLAFHGGTGSTGFLRARPGPRGAPGRWGNAGEAACA